MQRSKGGETVLHENGFGDFELQSVSRYARRSERAHDHLYNTAILQLGGGQIDCNLDLVWPFRRLLTGLLKYPFAEPDDQPSLFGKRNKLCRRDQAANTFPPIGEKNSSPPFTPKNPLRLSRVSRRTQARCEIVPYNRRVRTERCHQPGVFVAAVQQLGPLFHGSFFGPQLGAPECAFVPLFTAAENANLRIG